MNLIRLLLISNKHKVINIFLLLIILVTQSCFIYGKKKDLSLETINKKKETLISSLSSINISDNKIIITGSGFTEVTFVKIQGNGVNMDLSIDSKSDKQIFTSTTGALSLLVNKTFNLIIGTADAQAFYPVTVTLSSLGAVAGQILKYNGTAWAPATFANSQVYLGTWDAISDNPHLANTSPISGDYYIVSIAGSYNGTAYDIGDWIMYDGTIWTKIVSMSGTKLSISGGTLTGDLVLNSLLKFKGNTNYVTLKTSSSLASDLTLTLPSSTGTIGQVLTTDGAGVMSWTTPGTINTPIGSAGGGLTGSYPNPTIATGLSATKIADGSVNNTHFQYLSGVSSNIQIQLNEKMSSTLSNANIFVGNGSNIATGVPISGDATLSNTGALNLNTVTVSKGGTGLTSGTNGGIPYFSGTTTMASSGVLAANAVILGGGSGTAPKTTNIGIANQVLRIPGAGGEPTFGAVDLSKTAAVTGTLPVSNGGTGITTIATNQLLYGSSTGVISGLAAPASATANVLLSAQTTGIPMWSTTTTGNVLQGSVNGMVFGPITNIAPGADFTITQNSVNPFTSMSTNAVANTLFLKAGNIGVRTTTPTNIISLNGDAARTMWMERNSTANSAGNNLTLQSSGASIGASDKNGGNLLLSSGIATGTGNSMIQFLTSNSQALTNTTDNAPTVKMTILGNGNIGIGTATPSTQLEISSNVPTLRLRDTKSASHIPSIYGSISFFTSDHSNEISSIKSISTLTGAEPNGELAFFTSEFEQVASEKVRIDQNGNVGIGTTDPQYKLHVVGITGSTVGYFSDGTATCSITPSAGGNISCSSDERLKKNIKDFSDSLSLEYILKLNTITYDWKNINNGRHTGYLAQEVEKIAPEFVITGEDGFKQISYSGLIPWITGAIKAFYGEFKVILSRVMILVDDSLENTLAIAELKREFQDLSNDNKVIKSYLCEQDPKASFCK